MRNPIRYSIPWIDARLAWSMANCNMPSIANSQKKHCATFLNYYVRALEPLKPKHK